MNRADYFLGANAPTGFYSLYDSFIDVENGGTLYIIKGGPGCGKSSFMKKIGESLQNDGRFVEFIHCSADPDSLDGIYIPDLDTAYVDGTSPHVIEPKYPAAAEQYINLGQFYDCAAIRECRDEIIKINHEYTSLYKRAYRLLSAADSVNSEIRTSVYGNDVLRKIKKRAKGIVSREIKRTGREDGKATPRFIDSFGCKGSVCLWDTVSGCKRVYTLDNNYGFAHYMLSEIAAAAVSAGYDVVLCLSPEHPEEIRHVIIKELSLAFVSTSRGNPYKGESCRHIRLDALVAPERLKALRGRLRFSAKIAESLLDEAEKVLKGAKALHDELEGIYNPYVNFKGVYDLADEHLLALRNKK